MALGLETSSGSEKFSGTLRICELACFSLSLRCWWHATPGREREKTTRASRRGKDRGEGSVGDGGLELLLKPEHATIPALEQDEAEAALLPPAAHLLMVVCCVED